MILGYQKSCLIILTWIVTFATNANSLLNITGDDFSDLYKNAPVLLLAVHNSLRKKHKVPPLRLKGKLNSLSREWAVKLATERVFHHKPQNEYGENLYWENYETGLHYPGQFVQAWYNEQKFFHRRIRFNELPRVSNFTQIIWKSTQFLGVAAVTNDSYKEVYLVCMYDPPGNILEDFADNIDMNELIPEPEVQLRYSRNISNRPYFSFYLLSIIIFAMRSIILK